jgi:hypothetical protein
VDSRDREMKAAQHLALARLFGLETVLLLCIVVMAGGNRCWSLTWWSTRTEVMKCKRKSSRKKTAVTSSSIPSKMKGRMIDTEFA